MELEAQVAATSPSGLIVRPLRDVSTWANVFSPSELPVLRSTADTLEDLRANEDEVDAHMLAEALAPDPLMTVKILAHVAQLRRARDSSDPESVTAALVFLGITPFFRAFGPQACVEDRLRGDPEAAEGFGAVLARSRRAANFALGFAVQRMDHDAAEIQQAALLHDLAELLLWLHAPRLASEVARRQRVEPALRSAEVQREVLHVCLAELGHELMRRWKLPRLLVDLADDRLEATSPQARTVLLAIRLARHSALDWDNAALPDDVQDIAVLLHMAPGPTLALLRDIDLA